MAIDGRAISIVAAIVRAEGERRQGPWIQPPLGARSLEGGTRPFSRKYVTRLP